MDTVILTDKEGNSLGQEEIIAAHTSEGKLHKAFSVFVFNPDRTKLLIQQRSKEKMLFALKWANTCCSHPFENESIADAGKRRLKEELGIDVPLEIHSSFVYRAKDPDGKGIEHEHDTILLGNIDETVQLHTDSSEIEDCKWINIDELQNDMEKNPEKYAPWFSVSLNMILQGIND